MEIRKRIIARLETLASQGPKQVEAVVLDSTQQGGYIVGVPAEGQGPSMVLTLQDYDRYSVALRSLEVTLQTNGPGNVADYLRHCAEQVIQRLTYLEEPLVLLELDAGEGIAQLRSDSPHQDGDEIIFWEALVRVEPQPKVSLARYAWTPGRHQRESRVYPVTFDTVGRMATDLASSLSEAAG